MWKSRVKKVYSSLKELESYNEIYGIATRLGYSDCKTLWKENPMIQGSTNPEDLKKILPVKCYDNGGKTFDRYTVVYLDDKYKVQGKVWYTMLGMSNNPFEGFGQHCEGQLGKHLGKKIAFDDLPEDCKKLVLIELQTKK